MAFQMVNVYSVVLKAESPRGLDLSVRSSHIQTDPLTSAAAAPPLSYKSYNPNYSITYIRLRHLITKCSQLSDWRYLKGLCGTVLCDLCLSTGHGRFTLFTENRVEKDDYYVCLRLLTSCME